MGLFQLFYEFIKPWIWIPLGIAYMGIIFVILLENRNVNKALSYIVILIFVPVIGLIVFYFFGRDFRKRIRFKFRNERDLNTIKKFKLNKIEYHTGFSFYPSRNGGVFLCEICHLLCKFCDLPLSN